MSKKTTKQKLAVEFGMNVQTVSMKLYKAGIEPDDPRAREVLAEYKKNFGRQDNEGSQTEKRKQEVELLERKNRIAQKLEDGTYITRDKVEKYFQVGIQKLELVMPKLQSEFGLDEKIIKRGQELFDEARTEWSKAVKPIIYAK